MNVSRDDRLTEKLATTISGPELSVVVPTHCERANILPIIEEISSSLSDIKFEIIFVDDDSSDGTVEEVRRIAQNDCENRIRCIHRIGRRGLSSACIEGILSVSAPIVAVMDADMQHDARKLPVMLNALHEGADLVVGTRVLESGSFGEMSGVRQTISRLSSRVAKFLLHIDLSDPMSGFFMLRRSLAMTVVRDLSGLGFKILLDMVASLPRGTKIVEIPYQFRTRHAGESKLDSGVAFQFLLLLLDKTVGKFIPTSFLAFSVVGGLGVIVHFLILGILFKGIDLSFTVSQTMATSGAMVFNFFVNNALTFRDYRLRGWRLIPGLGSFLAISSIGAIGNVGIASVLFTDYHVAWTGSAFAGVLVGAVWNFGMSRAFTWRATPS